MHVVDDFRASAVDIQNRLPHQVLVQQNPARLIDKRRKRLSVFCRADENRVLLDLAHLVPGHELVGLAPTVIDQNANRLGVRVGHSEDQIGYLSNAVLDFAGAHRSLVQVGKEVELEILLRAGAGTAGLG